MRDYYCSDSKVKFFYGDNWTGLADCGIPLSRGAVWASQFSGDPQPISDFLPHSFSGQSLAPATTDPPMPWTQRTLDLPRFSRGFHLITSLVTEAMPEIEELSTGVLQVFIQHTSASLTLNENADPDVGMDLEASFSAIVPETFPYTHICEGSDDMPAHVKASLLGASLSIPVTAGRLALGTWQGINLCEHRNHASGRRLVLTLWGE